ncbi:hypothetical protein L6R50_18230 [Myxococcota bacterium]|nr:hypothetical protein [Myxococcota bacterium]
MRRASRLAGPLLTLGVLLATAGCGLKGPIAWGGAERDGAGASRGQEAGGLPGRPGSPAGAAAELDPPRGDAAGEVEGAFLRAVSDQGGCRFQEAHAGFRRLLEAWPEHDLAAEAMLRLGEVLAEPACPCHDVEAAAAAWREVLDRWPGSTSAGLARGYLARERSQAAPFP